MAVALAFPRPPVLNSAPLCTVTFAPAGNAVPLASMSRPALTTAPPENVLAPFARISVPGPDFTSVLLPAPLTIWPARVKVVWALVTSIAPAPVKEIARSVEAVAPVYWIVASPLLRTPFSTRLPGPAVGIVAMLTTNPPPICVGPV